MLKKHSRRLLILSENWKIPLRLLYREAEVTRLLSNMIKAYSVRYEDETKKTIDTHLRIDKELDMKRNMVIQTMIKQPEGFVEGLRAVVVDPHPSQEETNEMNTKAIEDATNEAKHILEQARKEAEKMKSEAFAAAQKKGYEEGMLQAKRETQKLKTEYEEKSSRLLQEYEAMTKELEPQMVQIIASLVEKITGILAQDREEVILYLVNKALKGMDKSDQYTIKVSKEDFEYISMRKNLLLAAIGRETQVYITEDAGLKKNQCFIETDLKIINCSLDVQLSNLITDLKLISGI
jgi:flagellar assembly protein FliH